MSAKRSTRALALLLTLPSAAFALGLGDIHLLSPLNAPLDAEIELVDVAPDEANTIQVQLASRDTFSKYGLEWPGYLNTVQLKTVRTPDGRQIVKLKSQDPITEPFVTLLVEVNWSRGHLVREYTMLLDPPVYTPGESQVAAAPVAAPTTGQGAREGSIARAETPPPATPAPQPAPTEQAAAAPSEQAAPAPTPAEPAPKPAPSRSRPARAAHAEPAPSSEEPAGAGSTHLVQRGETLSAIAADVAGAKVTSAKARSWMLAIYQANPQAFAKNMNVMHSGAVLRIPEASAAEAISPTEATAEIRRQYAAWRGETPTRAASAGTQPGRLKLVTPTESQPAAANTTPPSAAGTSSAKPGAGPGAATGAQGDKRLLELRNQELARIQSQSAAKQGEAAAPPAATAAPPAPPVTAPATAPAQQAPPPAATEQPPAAETAPAPAPAVTEEPAPTPVAKPPVRQPAPSGPSFLDTLLGYWWVLLALVALGLVGFFASRILRSRRKSEFDDSLGRLAAAGAEAADLGGMSAGRGFASAEPAPRMAAPAAAPLPDSAFLVEETGSHERPRISATGTHQAIPAAKHVASDETISSETAINLDQGDPLAEADFHMAYGLYDQAADLIRIAISREPARRDLKLKLLEVFFVWGNKEQFLTAARELAESRSEAAPGEWEKILIMGKQLAPEDPLFSGGGAVAGATAGGVDLDLEGGQSRVDFDLLGDAPPGAEAAQGGVDLDIGSAVGDLDATAESQSNITDRNVALLENSFAGAATGTTRQMTARVRPSGGSTQEMEGPTVEQPALVAPSQPTIRQKVETALRKGGEQTQELAIDDLGLDMGSAGIDTVDQPGIASAHASTPDAPTLVAGMDDQSRRVMEEAHRKAKEETGETTGAWQFDQNELEAALTQTSAALPDVSSTARMRALGRADLDVDVGDATGTHAVNGGVDLDVGTATGTHPANGGLDLDVGTATVPDAAFAATQRLASEDLALPDLEPVTMSEVGTKLDLARAYMDMGDPDGARNILEEVLTEGSAAQKQEAQRLIESLPG
jgi:pilus assembly protein FimV